MTPNQFRRRFRYWQKKFLMADWDIEIKFEPPPEGNRAAFDCNPEYKEGWVWLDPERVPMEDDAKMEKWIVHELVHGPQWTLEKKAEDWAGDDETKYEDVRIIAETVATKWEEIILNVARKR